MLLNFIGFKSREPRIPGAPFSFILQSSIIGRPSTSNSRYSNGNTRERLCRQTLAREGLNRV